MYIYLINYEDVGQYFNQSIPLYGFNVCYQIDRERGNWMLIENALRNDGCAILVALFR